MDVKTESYNENEDDEWLYGGTNDEPEQQNVQDLNENLGDLDDKDKEDDLNDEYKRLQSMEQNQNDDLSTIETAVAASNGDESIVGENKAKEAVATAQIEDNGDEGGEDDEDDEDDDDDDDDDDDVKVKVVIGPVSKPFNTLTTQTSKTNQIQTTNATAKPPTQVKGVDLEAQGSINDVPTLDFDIQQIKDEDKPWRKPGADITDYFNYGFNEETWIAYCMKQKKLRSENAAGIKQVTINQTAPLIGQIPTTTTMQPSNGTAILANPPGLAPNPNFIHKIPQPSHVQRPILQAGPGMQQPRKFGQIDVIGSTENTSRRPQFEIEMNMQNQIAVVASGGFPPPHAGMPDLSAPPPGWSPQQPPSLVQTGPPPSLVQGPPPGVQLRPPGTGPMQRMSHPPQGPMNFGQQNYQYMGHPPPMLHERPPGMNYGYVPQFGGMPRNPVPPASHQWEKPNVNAPEQYYQEQASPRSRSRTPTPKKSSHSRSKSPTVDKYSKDQDQSKYKHNRDYNRGSDYRRSPSPRRSYRSHRDYDNRRGSEYDSRRSGGDHREKSRSRDRSRDKERSRSRSRDRSRSREDRYKRSRRKSEHSDDEYRSSKSHKRSKKSRKGRDSNDRETHSKSITNDSISNDQQQQSNKSSNDNKND